MKKKLIHQALLAFSVMLLLSCEKEEQVIPVDSIFPIKTGNSWTMRNVEIDPYNQKHYSTNIFEVGEKVNIQGVDCYLLNDDSTNTHKFVANNDEEGNFVTCGAYSNQDTMLVSSIQFKKSAVVGENWDCTSVYFRGDEMVQYTTSIKCTTLDTLITTPKGSFNCKGYEESSISGQGYTRYYLALNIGMVRMEDHSNGRMDSYSELMDYVINE